MINEKLLENCTLINEGFFISAKEKKAIMDNQKAIANCCKTHPLLKDYRIDNFRTMSFSEHSTIVVADGYETKNVVTSDKLKKISEMFEQISSKYKVRVNAVFKVRNKLCKSIVVHSYPSKKFEYKDNL